MASKAHQDVQNQLRIRLWEAEMTLRGCLAEARAAVETFGATPHNPGAHERLWHTTKRELEALEEYRQAFHEWTRFVREGEVPDRLRSHLAE